MAAADLTELDCSTCEPHLRRARGCDVAPYVAQRSLHFRGTLYNTPVCPRRTLMRNPWMSEVFALDSAYDGRVGDTRDRLSVMAGQALQILSDARAWRRAEAARERERSDGGP